MFFEANRGQTDPQVKFLARGSGYGLFLTEDEAVLELRPARSRQLSTISSTNQPVSSSIIRMHLAGAQAPAQVIGTFPLPGKSNYFIGNDPSKWRQNIPQFGGVQYTAIYPGIDLKYYGNQGQLEYDFRVAPGADPSRIAMDFTGVSARIDSDASGDLILSTAGGDVHFHAPRIYQPAVAAAGNSPARPEQAIAGSFRQFADNKVGFALADYDHSRELVIDPVLSYSTYIGGSGSEANVQVAVDSGLQIYVAGSTTSADFPLSPKNSSNANEFQQTTLNGTQNIFIAVLNSTLQPPQYLDSAQLVYSTYLGGSGSDTLAGLAVDTNFGIYVAGTTTSTDFPTTANAFEPPPGAAGLHGFLSKIAFASATNPQVYSLAYSTYLAGNGSDIVAGLAIDINQNAYLTGITTSTNAVSDGFPANANAYQQSSNAPAGAVDYPQFFASKINTNGSGKPSMLYSTYFGGGNPATGVLTNCSASNLQPPCGGVAVDQQGNMYITGTTNMLPVQGSNGEAAFPLLDAQQPCLNQGSTTTSCLSNNPTTLTDAFVAKFNPNFPGPSSLLYSTYLGGNGVDTGLAIAADTSGNAYVTGSTQSTNWVCDCAGFQTGGYGGNGDAFIAKIGSQSGSIYPLNYLTYLGGPGVDVGNAIQVDSVQTAHVAGTTTSGTGTLTVNPLQPSSGSSYDGGVYGGGGDAFVASISTTSGGTNQNPNGDSITYLGGNQSDQGTGIALDIFGSKYVAGTTLSPNFPLSANPFQNQLNSGSQDAFVTRIGSASTLTVTTAASSPAPSPVALGTQVAFIFNITNNGPDIASQVNFVGTVQPNTGLAALSSAPTGRITGGTGTCNAAQGQSEAVPCFIPSLAVGATASVEIDVTTNATTTPVVNLITTTGTASANGSSVIVTSPAQQVNVVDFTLSASTPTPISAGQTANIQVTFCPSNPQFGYSATITPTQTTLPSMVTASTPTFNPINVTLSGSGCQSTTLTIPTVARPVTVGTLLLRRGSLYATWFPIGGLSLIGLGIGAGRKPRRWLVAILLAFIATLILLQPGCGSASTTTTTTGGTLAGNYTITVIGSAGTGASHQAQVQLRVN